MFIIHAAHKIWFELLNQKERDGQSTWHVVGGGTGEVHTVFSLGIRDEQNTGLDRSNERGLYRNGSSRIRTGDMDWIGGELL